MPLVRPFLASSYWSRVAACRLHPRQFSLNMIICFYFHRGRFLRLIVCSSVFFFPFFCWGNYSLWAMTSNTVINAFASAVFIWVSENGVQTGCCGQVKFSVLCAASAIVLACLPHRRKLLWSLTSCLPTTLRVIIRFLWANSVMRATESGTSYISFLWSSAHWSFWKSGSMLRAQTTSGHCTQRQPSENKRARTYFINIWHWKFRSVRRPV